VGICVVGEGRRVMMERRRVLRMMVMGIFHGDFLLSASTCYPSQ